MTEGRRVVTFDAMADPRCRGKCKGTRGANEGPAIAGHMPDGRKVLYCPCCEHTLRRVQIDEPGVPPNMNPDARAIPTRYEDSICGYDVVRLAGLH